MSSTRQRPKAYAQMSDTEMKPLNSAVDDDDGDEGETPTDKWLKYALHKLHALLWLLLAGTLAWYTQLWDIITSGHPATRPGTDMNRFFFNIGVAGFSGWLLMAMCGPHLHLMQPVLANAQACYLSPHTRTGKSSRGASFAYGRYLLVYLKYFKNINMEWEDYWPQAIPIATACAVSSLIAFTAAFWPVWGWLTIPSIFVLFLGALNSAHFVPI